MVWQESIPRRCQTRIQFFRSPNILKCSLLRVIKMCLFKNASMLNLKCREYLNLNYASSLAETPPCFVDNYICSHSYYSRLFQYFLGRMLICPAVAALCGIPQGGNSIPLLCTHVLLFFLQCLFPIQFVRFYFLCLPSTNCKFFLMLFYWGLLTEPLI